MPRSKGQLGKGTIFGIGTLASGTVGSYTAIAQLKDLEAPETEFEKVDISNMDSPDDIMENIPGMGETGDVDYEGVFTEAQYTAINDFVLTDRHMRILLKTGGAWTFVGRVAKIGAKIAVKDAITSNFTLQVTGKVTWTPAV